MYLTVRIYPGIAIAVGLAVLETWFGLVMAYYTNYSVSFFIASAGVVLYLLARLLASRGFVGNRAVRLQEPAPTSEARETPGIVA
jgi:ABC-type Mn2+/Zn2+ transport system permease subunit